MIIAGTGHRPKKLGLDYSEVSDQVLREFLTLELKKLSEEREIDLVLSGMALGFDLALAESARRVGIPYVAVLPFVGMQDKWPKKSQNRFTDALYWANKTIVVSDGGWSNDKYLARDRYLVDNSDLMFAMFNGHGATSGTGYTLAYAFEKYREVVNLWKPWVKFRNKRVH